MPGTQTIGDVIKRARIRKRLTADDVAKACNVSRSRIYQWESADFVLPKNFPALSAALGISIRRLRETNRDRERVAA